MDATTAAKLLLDSKANLSDGHRKNWVAVGNMRKAENELKAMGMMLCPDCLGRGEVRTTIEIIDTPCDWCGRTGWDDTRKCTCWKCAGSGKIYNEKYGFETCQVCKGTRIIPCKENSTKGATA